MTAEVTERNVGLIQYRIPDLHRRLMVGAAFLGKKDSGKRMLIKNRRLMPTPSAVATTLLHPDKVTRTGGITVKWLSAPFAQGTSSENNVGDRVRASRWLRPLSVGSSIFRYGDRSI